MAELTTGKEIVDIRLISARGKGRSENKGRVRRGKGEYEALIRRRKDLALSSRGGHAH